MQKKLFWLLLTGLLQSYAFAQKNLTLHGTVYSSGDVPLSGADISVTELDRVVQTDAEGNFSFTNIPAGVYNVTIALTGYKMLHKTVTMSVGKDLYLKFKLVENDDQLPQITVTAEKRETDLQKTPMAVSAIEGNELLENKIGTMGDLLQSAPNLYVMNSGSPTLNIAAIRGILTFSTQPAVGVYIDGVPMFDAYSSSMQFLDIDRIEILRGPQSTLYGRNALGGIINVITKKPGDDVHGFAEAGTGNYGQQHYAASVSGPVVKKKLFFGLSGLYDTRNGFYTNLYDNKKYDKPQTYNCNFYLKYLASDKLSFTFNAKGEYNNVRGAFPYAITPQEAFEHPYQIDQNGSNIEKRKLYTLSLNAVYKTGTTQFSSTTAFTRLSDTYRDYDYDYTPYDILSFEMPLQTQKTFTQEFRMTGNYGDHVKVTAGVFGFIDQKPSQTVFEYGPDYLMLDSTSGAPYTLNIYSDPHTYGIAGYTNVDYAFTDKFTLSAGLRYDYETRNMTFSTDMVKNPNPPEVIAPSREIKGHDGAFSPKVSVNYNFTDNMMVYASYTRGYHPGGFNQNTTDPSLLNYKQEYTDNFELGYKSEWFEHKLRANADVFYTNWKDQQQTLQLPADATENVGHLVNKGAELELAALPVKEIEINYNLGYVHTDYKTLILPNAAGTANENYVGNKQIFTPDVSSALSVTFRHSISKDWSFYVLPQWKYMGKQYMTFYNDLIQKPFSLLNAFVGFKYKMLDLSCWGKNLGNVRYLSFAYATELGAITQVLLGDPRLWGVTLRASF